MNATLNLTTIERIEEVRQAVRNLAAKGGMTADERAVAMGNLAEAEMTLRLRQRQN
jgi:hypothetical protein